MILLDTNVISAFMKPEKDAAVAAWLDTQPRESLWTTAITVFEVRVGLDLMALDRRQQTLERAFARALEQAFDGRVVPFDESAAQAAGRIAAARRKIGRSLEIRDVQIAGIALARKASIATRNIRHFEGLGIPLIDPWSA
ncbi:MAG TPA: type II toxin-antitoxin system VapC family toxin [Thermoanaerobaculia bacterium]|nr:type II toxin-antitoxin system VapC family toxin [Thermoanaerobaculia bacterium]